MDSPKVEQRRMIPPEGILEETGFERILRALEDPTLPQEERKTLEYIIAGLGE